MAQVVRNSAQDVPVDVLAGVLQHVDQADRLRCCAIVSRRWRQAANMTINSVKFAGLGQQGLDNLSEWLQSNEYVSRLQSVEVVCIPPPHAHDHTKHVLHVPFAALQHLSSLELLQCQIQAVGPAAAMMGSSAATTAGVSARRTAATAATAVPEANCLGALTALSRLELVESCIDLSELSSCTGLQDLMLCNVSHVGGDLVSPLASALCHLTQLTHLNFWHSIEKPNRRQRGQLSAIFASLSSMQQLKQLQLCLEPFQPAYLAHIPTSLSSLCLHGAPVVSLRTMPQLKNMTQLQCLRLVQPLKIDPAALCSLTQLTWLFVSEHQLASAVAVAQLLNAVRQLKRLKHLELSNCFGDECPEPQLYAALTASDQLESLDIIGNHIDTEAFEYMFDADTSLTALTSLATSSELFPDSDGFQRLVACCPALQQLAIVGDEDFADEPLEGISELKGLADFTTLILNSCELNDESLEEVAACTQLKELMVDAHFDALEPITSTGLQRLTKLTGLTKLFVYARLDDDYLEADLVGPDVYSQFQQAIAKFK